MTQPEDAWAQVERRAVSSGASGLQADDRDLLAQVALSEAPMNPHRGAGGAMSSGGPGMMPPMMMGAGGAGAQQSGGSSGLSGSMPARGDTGAGGPTLATQGVSPAASLQTAPPAPSGSGAGAAPSLGASGAGGAALSPAAGSGGAGAPESTAEPAADEQGTPQADAEVGGQDTGGSQPQRPRDGFIADPDAVATMAASWSELRERLDRIDRAETEARLGLAQAAVRPQQAVLDLIRMWLSGAVDEAGGMESKLRRAMKEYTSVDDEAVAEIRRELPDD